jgi:hypothetical protein
MLIGAPGLRTEAALSRTFRRLLRLPPLLLSHSSELSEPLLSLLSLPELVSESVSLLRFFGGDDDAVDWPRPEEVEAEAEGGDCAWSISCSVVSTRCFKAFVTSRAARK